MKTLLLSIILIFSTILVNAQDFKRERQRNRDKVETIHQFQRKKVSKKYEIRQERKERRRENIKQNNCLKEERNFHRNRYKNRRK